MYCMSVTTILIYVFVHSDHARPFPEPIHVIVVTEMTE